MEGRIVLNALRHHRGRHHQQREVVDVQVVCSTPCGITEVGTPRPRDRMSFRRVLNALRHHRGRHRTAPPHFDDAIMVLNALRHHRGRHMVGRGTPVATVSAQRLAASQRSAPPASSPGCGTRRSCSTPCGITEVGTIGSSAFTPSFRRAQRLAASQRSAPSRRPPTRFRPTCSTPCGITEVGTCPRGCYQEGYHACSTPCGITEVGTPWRNAGLLQRGVLNALRHHRGRHGDPQTDQRCEVRVLNALRHHRGRHNTCRRSR